MTSKTKKTLIRIVLTIAVAIIPFYLSNRTFIADFLCEMNAVLQAVSLVVYFFHVAHEGKYFRIKLHNQPYIFIGYFIIPSVYVTVRNILSFKIEILWLRDKLVFDFTKW